VIDESVNQYLNDNWKVTSEALKPIISKTIEDIMLGFMQRIFNHIPGDFFIGGLSEPNKLTLESN
jgi:Haemolymph juvenile hormone binding protein (JHBP)